MSGTFWKAGLLIIDPMLLQQGNGTMDDGIAAGPQGAGFIPDRNDRSIEGDTLILQYGPLADSRGPSVVLKVHLEGTGDNPTIVGQYGPATMYKFEDKDVGRVVMSDEVCAALLERIPVLSGRLHRDCATSINTHICVIGPFNIYVGHAQAEGWKKLIAKQETNNQGEVISGIDVPLMAALPAMYNCQWVLLYINEVIDYHWLGR